jgi:zinc/manganese transport system permease protein
MTIVHTGLLSGPLSHPFFVNALVAGTAIAVACGLVGYFLVLRAQVFTADALSHVAFTGALAALAFGIELHIGLFTLTIAIALLMGTIGRRGLADDVVIGSIFAWVLGLGVFFLTLYTTNRSTANGAAGVNVLFGSIFGISAADARLATIIAVAVCLLQLLIARPLLFATLDPVVAAGRGVPVRLLGFAFLALAGATTAEAVQAVGALLLLGLLSAPAGTAHRLTARPYLALGLSVAIAVLDVWVGLGLSYAIPVLPPSFAILAVSSAGFAIALGVPAVHRLVTNRAAPAAP